MTVINEIWVRDKGEFRKVNKFYEFQGDEWVEVSAERALKKILEHRAKMAALWWWVAAVAFTAGAARLLLT